MATPPPDLPSPTESGDTMDKTYPERANTIYHQAYNSKGEQVVYGSRSSFDPHTDEHVMHAAVEFHYAAKRGAVVKDHRVGDILISTVVAGGPKVPPMRDLYMDPHYQREMDALHDRRVGEGPIQAPPGAEGTTGHPAPDGSVCWTRVTSGQVDCLSCGQGWDYGDTDPPPCPKKAKPAETPRSFEWLYFMMWGAGLGVTCYILLERFAR